MSTLVVSVDSRLTIDQVSGGTVVNGQAVFNLGAIAIGETVIRTFQARALRAAKLLIIDADVSVTAKNDPELENNSASIFVNASPKNDNFQNAIVLGSTNGSVNFSNALATKQTNILGRSEPAHAVDAQGNPIAGGTSVWYQWVATVTGDVEFNTFGSNFDTLLAAYFVTSVGNQLTLVARNDDAGGITSRISFRAIQGETYFIAIDGFGAAQGSGSLNWSAVAEVVPKPAPQRHLQHEFAQYSDGRQRRTVKILGEGFNSSSQIYVLEEGESLNALRFRSRNFLQTTFRNNSNELEAEFPASLFSQARKLRIVAIRGNEVSNPVEIAVVRDQVLPANSSVVLGRIIANADRIIRQAGGSGEGEGAIEIYELEGHVTLNHLSVEGASIRLEINRAANSLHVRITQGSIKLTNVPRYNTITLWSGQSFEFDLDGEGELTNLARAVIETPLREKGIDVQVDRAHLLLGTTNDSSGRPMLGIELFGSLRFSQIAGLVNVPIAVDKIVLTRNEGLRIGGEIGPLNFDLGGLVKLQDVVFTFQPGATPQEDTFSGKAKIVTALIEAFGSAEVKNGVLNSVSGGINIPGVTGLPLGPLNITGGSLGLQNLLTPENLQVRVGADATIGNPVVSKVIQLSDVGVFYRLPAAFGGDGSLKILKVNAASASIDLDLSKQKFKFGGEVLLIPSFPIFDVRGELSAAVSSQGIKVSGYAQGTVQFPDGNGGLYDVLKACGNFFGFSVGPCVRFPFEIFSVRVAYQNNEFSYSTSFPIIGKTSVRVKQVQGALQAAVDLFSDIPNLKTHFVFGGSGEGENPNLTIGTLTVPFGAPRIIVSVGATNDEPLFDLIDPNGNRYTPTTASSLGGTFFQNTSAHKSIYIIENPIAGEWTAEAHSGVSGSLQFEAWGANAAPQFDDLSVLEAGNSVQINYQVHDADDDPLVSLYYSTSPDTPDGVLIAENIPASQTQSVFWNAFNGSVPSGTYYVYAVAEDGFNTPVFSFAPTPITVQDPNAPPAPSFVSLSRSKIQSTSSGRE